MNNHANEGTYSNIISSIAVTAASQVEGIASVTFEPGLRSTKSKKSKNSAVSVVLKKNLVYIEMYINVYYGKIIPLVVCALQEKIKSDIENATKYKVKTIDVYIVGSVDTI